MSQGYESQIKQPEDIQEGISDIRENPAFKVVANDARKIEERNARTAKKESSQKEVQFDKDLEKVNKIIKGLDVDPIKKKTVLFVIKEEQEKRDAFKSEFEQRTAGENTSNAQNLVTFVQHEDERRHNAKQTIYFLVKKYFEPKEIETEQLLQDKEETQQTLPQILPIPQDEQGQNFSDWVERVNDAGCVTKDDVIELYEDINDERMPFGTVSQNFLQAFKYLKPSTLLEFNTDYSFGEEYVDYQRPILEEYTRAGELMLFSSMLSIGIFITCLGGIPSAATLSNALWAGIGALSSGAFTYIVNVDFFKKRKQKTQEIELTKKNNERNEQLRKVLQKTLNKLGSERKDNKSTQKQAAQKLAKEVNQKKKFDVDDHIALIQQCPSAVTDQEMMMCFIDHLSWDVSIVKPSEDEITEQIWSNRDYSIPLKEETLPVNRYSCYRDLGERFSNAFYKMPLDRLMIMASATLAHAVQAQARIANNKIKNQTNKKEDYQDQQGCQKTLKGMVSTILNKISLGKGYNEEFNSKSSELNLDSYTKVLEGLNKLTLGCNKATQEVVDTYLKSAHQTLSDLDLIKENWSIEALMDEIKSDKRLQSTQALNDVADAAKRKVPKIRKDLLEAAAKGEGRK